MRVDCFDFRRSDKKQKQTCSKKCSALGSKCSDKIENANDADDSFDEKSSHNDNYQGFSQEENHERVQNQSSHISKKHSKDIIVTDQASGGKGIDQTHHSHLSLINARQSKVIKQSDDKKRKSERLLLAKAQAREKHINTSPAMENRQGILGDPLDQSQLIIDQQKNQKSRIKDIDETDHSSLSLENASQSKVTKPCELLLLAKAKAREKYKNTSPAVENEQGILGQPLDESQLIINQQE